MRFVLIPLVMLGAACFDPTIDNGKTPCGTDGSCPPGFECSESQICFRKGSDPMPSGDACTAVSNFHATAASISAISLAWTGAPDAAAQISRQTYCSTDRYIVLATLDAGVSTYTDTLVQSGYSYWYALQITDGTGAVKQAATAARATNSEPLACQNGSNTPRSSGIPANDCPSE